MGKARLSRTPNQRTMEQNQMTTATTSKRGTWKACSFYLLPETKTRLDHYLLRLRLNDLDSTVDQSDIVHEALLLWLDAKENKSCETPKTAADKNELADLVDLVVSLKNDVEELQKWRKSQVATEEQWVENLRLKIKRAHGRGWVIRAMAKTKLNPDGKCQLTRIAENRKRTSVILPLSWIESESKAIFEIVDHICTMHKQKGLSLQDALKSYW